MKSSNRPTNSLRTAEAAAHVWNASPAGRTHAPDEEPGTRAFFDKVLDRRSNIELPWLSEFFPFESTQGKTVLELGCGAGYDAYQFCRYGARYTGIDIADRNIQRTRQHLGSYRYTPRVLCADIEHLPFADAAFDVVYSFGVLHHIPDIRRGLREAWRILRPGGQLWFAVYNKNSMVYWIDLFLVDHILLKGYRQRTFKERLTEIEFTTSTERPIVNVYTKRHIRQMTKQAGFAIRSAGVRKLEADDLPIQMGFKVPQAWLNFLGRLVGWYVVVKAQKC